MGTIAETYARFAAGLRFGDLPVEVVHRAKVSVLDLVGVMLAGSDMPFPRAVRDYLSSLGGKHEATMTRTGGRKFPAPSAALANGICGHALDMDDGHRFGALHPGVPVIPAALAAAEAIGADGARLIAGIVTGYEVIIRISRGINPSHLSRGFHTTGTVGTFGAAASVGNIIGLDAGRMTHALGLAGLQSAGLLEILHDGAMAKPIHPGHACSAGILAAELARRDAQGPRTIFEGPKGFLRAMTDAADMDAMVAGLGSEWEILRTYIKLHAACRHIHPAIDCALNIRAAQNVKPSQIQKISVETYPVAVQFCGDTIHPDTVSAAKFSLPFSVAMAMYLGDAFTDKYSEENIRHSAIHELAGRVEVSTKKEWEQSYPRLRGAGMVVTLNDGRQYRHRIDLPHGEPEYPATQEEIQGKFMANASLVVPPNHARAIMDAVMNLEDVPPSRLMEML
ncbi:MAG: MmgE/PrpD family protein [Deltaproteobacteria bacterium]|nr:MmgE/PrpD family protein [Deltaproteobacteria bacterium]